MSEYTDLVNKFYTAFADLDSDAMRACYHKDLVFEDPAFGEMDYENTCLMWKMLCDSQRDQNFAISTNDLREEGGLVKIIWEPKYKFRTGRQVHNIIYASFKFKDGLILYHRDHFNLYRWSRMALGFQGVLIGWTPFFKKGLRKQTHKMLSKYKSKHGLT